MKKSFILIIIAFYSLGAFAQKAKKERDYVSKGIGDRWYSTQLKRFKEPVIYSGKQDKEIYRFIWLRTFNQPIAIRIEKSDNSYMLYWKMTDGAGGYDPGELVVNEQKEISKEQWDAFVKKLNAINFWGVQKKKGGFPGFDGAQWVLEGKRQMSYHVLDIQSPGKESDFYKCCDYLIGLTGLKIPPDDKY